MIVVTPKAQIQDGEIKIHLIVISSVWTHVHHKIFLFLCSVLVCCNVKLMKVASVEQQ